MRSKEWDALLRELRFFVQHNVYGFADDETWSLDYTLAKWIIPRLKRFKRIGCISVPSGLTQKEWEGITQKILHTFCLVEKDDGARDFLYDNTKKGQKEYDEGMKLFSKYFLHLWW